MHHPNIMILATPVVQTDSFLTLHYRLAGPDGTNLVNTFDGQPATLSMGSGELSPGMEAVLLGLAEGTHTVFDLTEGQAFGPRNPDLMQRVAIKLLRNMAELDETWDVGDVVQFPTPDGQSTFAGMLRELDPNGQWVLIDFNHPLAGQRVIFEVHLIGVLAA